MGTCLPGGTVPNPGPVLALLPGPLALGQVCLWGQRSLILQGHFGRGVTEGHRVIISTIKELRPPEEQSGSARLGHLFILPQGGTCDSDDQDSAGSGARGQPPGQLGWDSPRAQFPMPILTLSHHTLCSKSPSTETLPLHEANLGTSCR